MREVSSCNSAGRDAVTDAAMWTRSSSWLMVRGARGGDGVAPALQIPGFLLGLTTPIVGAGPSVGPDAREGSRTPDAPGRNAAGRPATRAFSAVAAGEGFLVEAHGLGHTLVAVAVGQPQVVDDQAGVDEKATEDRGPRAPRRAVRRCRAAPCIRPAAVGRSSTTSNDSIRPSCCSRP